MITDFRQRGDPPMRTGLGNLRALNNRQSVRLALWASDRREPVVRRKVFQIDTCLLVEVAFMLTINGWNDLRQFGIDVLTGEACGLSYRLLCDVTKEGKQTLEKALGVIALELADNWNNGSATDPHVGSVMLFAADRRQMTAPLMSGSRVSFRQVIVAND